MSRVFSAGSTWQCGFTVSLGGSAARLRALELTSWGGGEIGIPRTFGFAVGRGCLHNALTLPPPSPRLYFSFSFSKCSFSFSLMKLLSFSSRTLHEKCSSKSAYT